MADITRLACVAIYPMVDALCRVRQIPVCQLQRMDARQRKENQSDRATWQIV